MCPFPQKNKFLHQYVYRFLFFTQFDLLTLATIIKLKQNCINILLKNLFTLVIIINTCPSLFIWPPYQLELARLVTLLVPISSIRACRFDDFLPYKQWWGSVDFNKTDPYPYLRRTWLYINFHKIFIAWIKYKNKNKNIRWIFKEI